MKTFSNEYVPEDGLVILTAPEIDGGELYCADFRDIFFLVHKPTNSPIGFGRNGMQLGKKPFKMVRGLWLMDADEGMCNLHRNIELTSELLELRTF